MTDKEVILSLGTMLIRLHLENRALKGQLANMEDMQGCRIPWEDDLIKDLSGPLLYQTAENALALLQLGVDKAFDGSSLIHNLHQSIRPEELGVTATPILPSAQPKRRRKGLPVPKG
jgi:hypothetical protein